MSNESVSLSGSAAVQVIFWGPFQSSPPAGDVMTMVCARLYSTVTEERTGLAARAAAER